MTARDISFSPIVGIKDTFHVTSFSIGTPVGRLRIISFVGIFSFYLVVSLETKREDANKAYDPKTSYWCPDGKGGYMECILDADDGAKANVSCGHEVYLRNSN
jgi:hypothetical protein